MVYFLSQCHAFNIWWLDIWPSMGKFELGLFNYSFISQQKHLKHVNLSADLLDRLITKGMLRLWFWLCLWRRNKMQIQANKCQIMFRRNNSELRKEKVTISRRFLQGINTISAPRVRDSSYKWSNLCHQNLGHTNSRPNQNFSCFPEKQTQPKFFILSRKKPASQLHLKNCN